LGAPSDLSYLNYSINAENISASGDASAGTYCGRVYYSFNSAVLDAPKTESRKSEFSNADPTKIVKNSPSSATKTS